jgi:protein ImuB
MADKGGKIVACCARAIDLGVRPGMLHAEALATLPTLTCVDEDIDADRQTLTQLAVWSQRFSPVVGLEDGIAPTCLYIDITGCAPCFGNEELLARKAREEFSENGWTVAVVLADTVGAAWAISHYARPACGDIAGLPVAALRLSAATVSLLGQLGIERIAQLAVLPRDQIADRFGPEVSLRLDQAMGRAAEVITPFHEQPEAAASWAFDDPVERRETVAKVLDLLLERLQAVLEKRCCGTRLVECTLEQEGADSQRFECSLSRPARMANYLRPLLHARLDHLRVQGPIRAMCVRALMLERMPDEQRTLFDADGAGNEAALAQLLDSLVARLGRDALTKAHAVADPQPELACRFDCVLAESEEPPADELAVFVHRPLRMFPRPVAIQVVALLPLGTPQRFHYAGVGYAAVCCQGPERIETGWWRSADIRRDYYIVETTEGTRWWIFQRVDDGNWFLHGCFD